MKHKRITNQVEVVSLEIPISYRREGIPFDIPSAHPDRFCQDLHSAISLIPFSFLKKNLIGTSIRSAFYFLLCRGKIWCLFLFQLQVIPAQLQWRMRILCNCHLFHPRMWHWRWNFDVWPLLCCCSIDIRTFPIHLRFLSTLKQTQFCSRRWHQCTAFHPR